jgi:hypothetical protein
MTSTFTPGNSYFSPDWFHSGWHALLPPEALSVNGVVTTATVAEVDGDFDTLQADERCRQLFRGGLDAAIEWSPDDQADDPEQLALDTQRKARFERVLTAAGLQVPTTVRELASTMASLGLFERSTVNGAERWRTRNPLPNPLKALPLPNDLAADIRTLRVRAAAEPFEQAIIRRFEAADWPDKLLCSVGQLAEAIDATPEQTRAGIANLLAAGDFSVLRHGQPVDVATLPDHARFELVVDHDKFADGRITIVPAGDAE